MRDINLPSHVRGSFSFYLIAILRNACAGVYDRWRAAAPSPRTRTQMRVRVVVTSKRYIPPYIEAHQKIGLPKLAVALVLYFSRINPEQCATKNLQNLIKLIVA